MARRGTVSTCDLRRTAGARLFLADDAGDPFHSGSSAPAVQLPERFSDARGASFDSSWGSQNGMSIDQAARSRARSRRSSQREAGASPAVVGDQPTGGSQGRINPSDPCAPLSAPCAGGFRTPESTACGVPRRAAGQNSSRPLRPAKGYFDRLRSSDLRVDTGGWRSSCSA